MKEINPIREIISRNKWCNLERVLYSDDDPSDPDDGYFFLHEVRCNGIIVSILPYRHGEKGRLEYLLRNEVTPPWNTTKSVVSSITGGHEKGNNYNEDVVRELYEEAGYSISSSELGYLGTCRGTKSSDTIYHLYTVNLTGKVNVKPKGDGSTMEAQAWNEWKSNISEAEDPLVYVAHYRLAKYLTGERY